MWMMDIVVTVPHITLMPPAVQINIQDIQVCFPLTSHLKGSSFLEQHRIVCLENNSILGTSLNAYLQSSSLIYLLSFNNIMWFESLWDSQKHMKSYSDAQVNSYKPSYQFNIVIHHYLKFNPFIVQSNYWQSYSLGWTEGILKLKAWRW
jgi:hypothetical protein